MTARPGIVEQANVCAFCEKVAPETGKKYCAECAKLGAEMIDDIFGDALDSFLERLTKA